MEAKEESVQLKEKGNYFFQSKQYAEAIEAYTKAIVSTTTN